MLTKARLAIILVLMLFTLLGTSSGAGAAESPLEEFTHSDPLGLIANYHITSHLGLTPDSFEVWACNLPDGELDLKAAMVVSFLQREVAPFLSWLSDRQYQVAFSVGGTVYSSTDQDCFDTVDSQSPGDSRGSLVFLNNDGALWSGGGVGGVGRLCFLSDVYLCEESFPSNERQAILYTMVDLEEEGYEIAPETLETGISSKKALHTLGVTRTIVHEIGHTIAFPHSFTGSFSDPDVNEYNNPMDVMSGGTRAQFTFTTGSGSGSTSLSRGVLSGTLAINRYAAGWIPPERVDIYKGGVAEHYLAIPGAEGTQMAVIPLDTSGVFLTLGARMQRGYDAFLPKEGVEVYSVDQRHTACKSPFGGACWGLERRTQPFPAIPLDDTAHVLEVNETLELDNGVTISVTQQHSHGYTVEIDDGIPVDTTRFSDVPAEHLAADAIRWAYENNITVGIGGGRFGIGQTLTREETVTFLCRTYQPDQCQNPDLQASDTFSDLPVDHWANSSIGWAVNLGITTGVGSNQFGVGQELTREQMITFLHRASPSATTSAGYEFFSDLPQDADLWYQAPIAWAYLEGITSGVSERTFGLGTVLSREEAVLFLCRARAPDICPPSQTPLPSTTIPIG